MSVPIYDPRRHTFFVAPCPIANCHWCSEPCSTSEAAREARRMHVDRHPHSDLVEYVTQDQAVEHYTRREAQEETRA